MSDAAAQKPNFMTKLATFIVDKRNLFFSPDHHPPDLLRVFPELGQGREPTDGLSP